MSREKRRRLAERNLADGRTVVARVNGGIRKRCGCSPTAWNDCKHPWHGNYSHGGVEHRVSLHKWAKKAHDYVMLKTEAQTLFRWWQNTVDAGKSAAPLPATKRTLEAIATTYISDYVQHPDRRPNAKKEMERQVRVLVKAFGGRAIDAITKPMIEEFRLERRLAHEARLVTRAQVEALRASDKPVSADLTKEAQVAVRSTKAGRVSTNRLLERLRHLFAWAIEQEYTDTSPFVKGGKTVIKADRKVEGSRSRRLEDGEEERLLAASGTHLRACIEATLDTGMRRAEILGLQWKHVNLRERVIHLPATVAKTETARMVLFSPRLAAIMEMRQLGPDGEPNGAEAFVFGDETGGQIKSFKTAWKLTCQRAGITGLTFHDLRREAGSRMLDAGNSLTDVRDFLGHRSATQTNTYLATTIQRQRAAIEKRDSARTNLAQPPVGEPQPETTPAVTH